MKSTWLNCLNKITSSACFTENGKKFITFQVPRALFGKEYYATVFRDADEGWNDGAYYIMRCFAGYIPWPKEWYPPDQTTNTNAGSEVR